MKNGASNEIMTVDEFVVSAAEILLEQVWPVCLFFENIPLRLLLTPHSLSSLLADTWFQITLPQIFTVPQRRMTSLAPWRVLDMVWFSGHQKLFVLWWSLIIFCCFHGLGVVKHHQGQGCGVHLKYQHGVLSPVPMKGLAVLSQRTYEVTYTKYLPPTLKQPLIKSMLYGGIQEEADTRTAWKTGVTRRRGKI